MKDLFNRFKTSIIWSTLGFVLAFGIVSSGCSVSSGNSEDDAANSSEYYVKYMVDSDTIYFGGKLDVKVTDENNQKTTIQIPAKKPWEIVIGPLKKGFKATLEVNEIGNNHGHLKLYTQIFVSKDGSPFALKKIDQSDNPRTSVEIDYTIDY